MNQPRKNSKRIQDMDGFGNRLQLVMQMSQLTQTALSKIIGLTQPEISYYIHEKIKPRPIIRQRLAFELKVDYSWLAWGEGSLKYYRKNYPLELFHQSFSERFVFVLWWNNKSIEETCEKLVVSNTIMQYYMEGTRNPNSKFLDQLCEWLKIDMRWLAPELMPKPRLTLQELKEIHQIIINR